MPEERSKRITASLSLPEELTTPYGKLVYLYLWFERRTTVETLSSDLKVPQIRLYPVLRYLSDRGHLASDGPEIVFQG